MEAHAAIPPVVREGNGIVRTKIQRRDSVAWVSSSIRTMPPRDILSLEQLGAVNTLLMIALALAILTIIVNPTLAQYVWKALLMQLLVLTP